jgi:cysteinyl-tRNA synthetase
MKEAKNYNAVAAIRKIRHSMSLKHWRNPELFKLKLLAAAKRRREQIEKPS